jgi:hypothetical protein
MPKPKISAILNNCSVHVGVPECIQAFQHYAALEEGEAGLNEALNDPSYQEDYTLLKDLFADFYQQDKASFTWKQLEALLTVRVNHNPTAAQFILGPVLRQFMQAKKAAADLTQLQADGRYPTLTAAQVSHSLYKPLGIKITSHERPSGLSIVPVSADGLDAEGYFPPQESKMDDEAFEIDIYNENKEHWERLPQKLIATAERGQDQLLQDCPEVSLAFDRVSGGRTKENTEAGLVLLKQAVANLMTLKAPAKQTTAVAASGTVEQRTAERYALEAKQAFEARIRNKVKVDSTPQELEAVAQNVRTHYGLLFTQEKQAKFQVEEEQKIALKDLDQAQALPSESDESFATRLQEAELRAFRLGK